jgi:hypothetical protein
MMKSGLKRLQHATSAISMCAGVRRGVIGTVCAASSARGAVLSASAAGVRGLAGRGGGGKKGDDGGIEAIFEAANRGELQDVSRVTVVHLRSSTTSASMRRVSAYITFELGFCKINTLPSNVCVCVCMNV